MIWRLRAAWRHHPILSTGFALALAVMLFFAARAIAFAIYWSDPAHRNQPIAGWMTPRYVVQSWHVPPEVMIEALGEGPMPGKRRTLAEIAGDRGVAPEVLIGELSAVLEAYRAGHDD